MAEIQKLTMTTMQKTLIALALAVLTGAAVYETKRASGLQLQILDLEQRDATLAQKLAQLTSNNENLSNKLARANQDPVMSTERLRELLKLRGEVGLLRRRQHDLEQSIRAPNANQERGQTAAPMPSIRPSPFQVQLVLDGPAQDGQSMTNDSSGGEVLQVRKTPLLDYTAIQSASVSREVSSGSPVINIDFSPEGQELFAAITRENINKRLAIVLDGRVFSAPLIRSEITGGKAQITGNFTEEEARELAARITDAIPSP